MRYKLFVTDMDGTLLNSNKDITRENKTAINKLIENGVEVLLASGRHTAMLKEYPKRLGINTPVVGCNGGIISNLKTGEIHYISEMKIDSVVKSIEIANKLDLDFWIYEKDNIYYSSETDRIRMLSANNKSVSEDEIVPLKKYNGISEIIEASGKILKVLFILIGHQDVRETLYQELSKISDIEFCQSSDVFIDVMNKGTTKGRAVQMYAEKKGIKREEVITIGDNDNDISMLEYAGLGIAMGNAEESAKRASKYITRDCDSNGFGEAVDKILNGEL